MADWAVHGRPHCVAAVCAGIFKQGTILLHHPVVKRLLPKVFPGVMFYEGPTKFDDDGLS